MRLFALLLIAVAVVTTTVSAPAQPVQDYPTRPVTIVVPFPAGGSIDAVARIIGDRMKRALGKPVVVENVTGVGGSIGTGRVAHAAPDGYTIGIGNLSTHVINGATYRLGYDVIKDFAPITLLTREPMVVAARKTMPAEDLKGLTAWLKANPDKASAATGGRGDITEVAYMLFQRETETRFQLVPYRGTVAAFGDLMSGQIDLVFMQASSLLPQVSAGTVKAFAIMAPKRLHSAPDIPTTDEAGLPGFYIPYWFGLWAPKGTPYTIISKLNAAAVDALTDEGVREQLTTLGREIFPREQQTPDALGALQHAEIEKWWPIIKSAGIKAE